MLQTIVRFIREDAAAGMFEYAILLGVGLTNRLRFIRDVLLTPVFPAGGAR